MRATVQAAALGGWDGFLADRGLQTIDIGNCLGGNREAVDFIPLADFVRFSERVVETTRDISIPWLAGVSYDLSLLGRIADGINSATKVGVALRRFVEFFALLQDCTDIRLDREDGMACVSYRILHPEIWPRHHDAMFSLGIVAQILQRGTQGGWERVEFAFEAEQTEMCGDVASVLRAPCSFGADSNQLRFPEAMLDLAFPGSARISDARQLNSMIVEQRRKMPLVDRLSVLVFRDLNAVSIDQERIAREIGMSSRTMRRKLADESSSFQQVLDECRMRQAAFEFRTRPDLSIAQIALRLGYAEHSNFTRAFHRWSGISPQAYRAKLGSTVH
jgi:AraC-like DNA-binding protein